MSLFIGNIANSVILGDLEPIFEEYGPCRLKIQPNKSYGFVDYEQERDAEEALLNLKGKSVKGQEIRIEWSARSGKNKDLEEKNKDRRLYRSRYDDRRNSTNNRNSGCYGCGSHSHKLKDCRKKRNGSYHRRSRSKSYDRYRRRSRSRSRDKERERDDNRRTYRKRYDRSRSKSRDRSRSRSRSKSNDRRRRRSSSYSSRK